MDVEQIVAGLSRDQRELFMHPLLCEGGFIKRPVGKEPVLALPAPCIDLVTTRLGYEKFKLSELGLAVRAHLEIQP